MIALRLPRGPRALAPFFAALATGACAGGAGDAPSGPGGPTPEAVASVTVAPDLVTLRAGIGETVQLTATVRGTSGAVLTGRSIAWTSGDRTRAEVSATGLVTPVAVGTTAVTASVEGRSGAATVTIAPLPPNAIIIHPGVPSLPLGLAAQLNAAVTDGAGIVVPGRPITWGTSDGTVASVDADGLVTTRGTGTVTITAAADGLSAAVPLTVAARPPVGACRLPNQHGSVAFGFPRAAHRLRSTGTVRATVLFVDFSDAPAARTPESVLGILEPGAPDFLAAVSYGAMTLELRPTLRWFRMSRPSTQYGFPSQVTFLSHRDLLQEAANLAAATTDYSQADLLVVVTNPDAGAISFGPALVPNPGDGIAVPGRSTTIDNATNSGRDLLFWGGTWLAHEIGHLLSLPDLYDYSPPAVGGRLHVGEWSQMGQINGAGAEWSAFERWQLGWLADDQVVCPPAGTSLAVLTPIEVAGGLKAAVLPITPTLAVVVESRRALGFDHAIPQPGPLVYFIDTGVPSGRGTMRVLPLEDADQTKLWRTLRPGLSVTYRGTSVTHVSGTDGRDVVRVVRP